MYKCKQCGELNEANMMKNGGNGRSKSLCKACHTKNTNARMRRNRERLLEYKGGKCECCGYDKCKAALEFHHKDPSKKDPSFSSIRFWSFDRAKVELDKCLLLCANCHREEHEKLSRG